MSAPNVEAGNVAPQMDQSNSNAANTIYVGNLDPRVTESMLHEIFATVGAVIGVKIITVRKHNVYGSVNYAFVEFADPRAAEQAILDMNGRKIFNYEIRANWAQQSTHNNDTEDTKNHFHVFIGDIAPEITNEALTQAFSVFGSMSEAHVMWDPISAKSRGFGFVAFKDKSDAEQAIATMNGEWLGSRPIRCQTATPPPQPGQQLPFEVVVQQTPAYVTSIYVGNLPPNVDQAALVQPFQRFGYVQEVKIQADRGFAFVKMDTHENAASAIVHLQHVTINGSPAKLSWGKDRPPPGWHAAYRHPQEQNWYSTQMQYTAGRNRTSNHNPNVISATGHIPNGYGYHHNTASTNRPNLDPHNGQALSAVHAAQWNQQAATTAQHQQRQFY